MILEALAAGQAIYGLIKGAQATSDFNDAMKERKPYKTPQELYDIVKATQNMAQSGYDATTLNYLTTQNDRAFSSTLGAVQRLGGDANSVSAAFDQFMQNTFRVAGQNHALGLEAFSRFVSAKEMLANSKAAEWSSQQDIIKDRLQSANANKQAAFGNIQGGINTAISAYSISEMNKLYNPDGTKKKPGLGGFDHTYQGVQSSYNRGWDDMV